MIQYSVHPPNRFLAHHGHELLPDWPVPIASLLIVLQRCPLSLAMHTAATEECKQVMRSRFLQLGFAIATHLQQQDYLADVFDPATGLPLLSHSGDRRLDDVAVVRTCLGYRTVRCGECQLLEHPLWGDAVYPSVLVSSAPVQVLQASGAAMIGRVADGIEFPLESRFTDGLEGGDRAIEPINKPSEAILNKTL